MTSILFADWEAENRWEFISHKTATEQEIEDDPAYLMPNSNMALSVDIPDRGISEKLTELHRITSMVLVRDVDNDAYYLVMNGQGCDLSQDIALAYYILTDEIPADVALNTTITKPITQHGITFELLRNEILKTLMAHETVVEAKIKEAQS